MAKGKKVDIAPIRESRPYILWRRVSTKEQGKSELGLEAQVTIAKTFLGKDPVEIYTDVHTGTNLRGCDSLWKAIDHCKKDDFVLVIAKFDRLRNVQEALTILDAVGERNIIICDLPTTDRFVLTIMFAVAEKQAAIGKINTRLALAERKKQIEKDGGFISKAGNFCTHLGNEKGVDMSEAHIVAYANKKRAKEEWRQTGLFAWVELQLRKGRSRKDIVAEARAMYEKDPERWSTRQGRPLTEAILSLWAKDILPVI